MGPNSGAGWSSSAAHGGPINRSRVARLATFAAIAALAGTSAAAAGPSPTPPPLPHWAQLQSRQLPNVAAREGEEGEDPMEVADMADQYAQQRSLPAASVSAAALVAARAQAAKVPAGKATASELTDTPTDGEPPGYTDPYWSNAGSGFQMVSGRMTALAVDRGAYYAGAADGEQHAAESGCRRLWTGTERDNTAALATYRGRGGIVEEDSVIVTWDELPDDAVDTEFPEDAVGTDRSPAPARAGTAGRPA